jgi:hypothetical protein
MYRNRRRVSKMVLIAEIFGAGCAALVVLAFNITILTVGVLIVLKVSGVIK